MMQNYIIYIGVFIVNCTIVCLYNVFCEFYNNRQGNKYHTELQSRVDFNIDNPSISDLDKAYRYYSPENFKNRFASLIYAISRGISHILTFIGFLLIGLFFFLAYQHSYLTCYMPIAVIIRCFLSFLIDVILTKSCILLVNRFPNESEIVISRMRESC